MNILYRYTSDGEGIFSAGKRLLPEDLVEEARNARAWLPKPELSPSDDYRFYMTAKGKEQYEKTLLLVHKKYLKDIQVQEVPLDVVNTVGHIVYEDEWQVVIKKQKPHIIDEVGFDFGWDERDVWKLEAPITELESKELTWHFDIPFLWENGGYYNLTPQEVLDHPEKHPKEWERVQQADLSHPIDVMENKGRLTILDGLHRLMKAVIQGHQTVQVRIHSRELISKIASFDS